MRIFLLFSFLLICNICFAQDAIYFKSGEVIACKILKVSKSEILFKNNDSSNTRFTPIYLVSKYEFNTAYQPKKDSIISEYVEVNIEDKQPLPIISNDSIPLLNKWDYVGLAGRDLKSGVNLIIIGSICGLISPLCVYNEKVVTKIEFPTYDQNTQQYKIYSIELTSYKPNYFGVYAMATAGLIFNIWGIIEIHNSGEKLEKAGNKSTPVLSYGLSPAGVSLVYRF